MNKCLNSQCNNVTDNPKYCSRSCSVTDLNRKHPKRKRKKYYCDICGNETPYKRKYCETHSKHQWSNVTVRDIINRKNNRPYTTIGGHARRSYLKSKRPQSCEVCGYKKHFQICHIKPIHSFDKSTTINIVNSLTNLIALCPNCHWELDNGILDINLG